MSVNFRSQLTLFIAAKVLLYQLKIVNKKRCIDPEPGPSSGLHNFKLLMETFAAISCMLVMDPVPRALASKAQPKLPELIGAVTKLISCYGLCTRALASKAQPKLPELIGAVTKLVSCYGLCTRALASKAQPKLPELIGAVTKLISCYGLCTRALASKAQPKLPELIGAVTKLISCYGLCTPCTGFKGSTEAPGIDWCSDKVNIMLWTLYPVHWLQRFNRSSRN